MALRLYKVYSGDEFNKLTKKLTFAKFLNKKENHNGMQYKTGFNKDIRYFNGSGWSSSGGMYFFDIQKSYMYSDYGEILRKVTIPNEAKVYVEKDKFKADMFLLSDRVYLDSLLDTDNILKLICVNGDMLKYLKEQTEEICLRAVQQNGNALEYVKKQTEEICMEAVKQNGVALRYVEEQTFEICFAAVSQTKNALEYSKFLHPEITLEAVKNGMGLLEWSKIELLQSLKNMVNKINSQSRKQS